MTMRPTRRAVVLGTAAVALPLPIGWVTSPQSQVPAMASEWLDEQYAYCCSFRDVFHPGGKIDRIEPEAGDLRLWHMARQSLQTATDRLIFSPSACSDDVVLKSAALGCFFAKEPLPDCQWVVGHAARWIGAVEQDVIAFNCTGVRTWRYEAGLDA